MNNDLNSIADKHKDKVADNAPNYIEIDIGKHARMIGYPDLNRRYENVKAIFPINGPEKGMKVRIDGRTFVNYSRYGAGIAVPGYVAKDAGIPYDKYIPNDSMILNFT